MTNKLYSKIDASNRENKKKFAVLVDPDKMNDSSLDKILSFSPETIDYFFVGGSLMVHNQMAECIKKLKSQADIPVVIFPGSAFQVDAQADAILFLTLISGRNPDLLIGQQVTAAPMLKESGIEIMPTGYMLIDGGAPTAASYMSGTFPIPADKDEIASVTALAGEMLGLKLIYMDAGSGAKHPISENMIAAVKKQTNIPLIVGGGIRTAEQAYRTATAGADVVVVGNAIEKDPALIREISNAVHSSESVY